MLVLKYENNKSNNQIQTMAIAQINMHKDMQKLDKIKGRITINLAINYDLSISPTPKSCLSSSMRTTNQIIKFKQWLLLKSICTKICKNWIKSREE